jgi:hypothetical protein
VHADHDEYSLQVSVKIEIWIENAHPQLHTRISIGTDESIVLIDEPPSVDGASGISIYKSERNKVDTVIGGVLGIMYPRGDTRSLTPQVRPICLVDGGPHLMSK